MDVDSINWEWDLMGTIKEMAEKGWFDEYSNSHFLIKAIKGKMDYFQGKEHLIIDRSYWGEDGTNATTFLMNFSIKFQILKDAFPAKDIEGFVKNQMSAGKKNYQEDQFIRALSEIHVLIFMIGFGPGEFKEALYEPPIGNNKKNPEARLIYKNDITIDIEVKTPGFNTSAENLKESLFIPGILMEHEELKTVRSLCRENNIIFKAPRINKLKDYINSAGEKFVKPPNNRHLNILFINWTYTDMDRKGYIEPYSLLYNNLNGILKNKDWCQRQGIDKGALEKISAIVVYQDTFNSLLFGDFRYQWQYYTFRMLPNMCMDPELLDVNILKDALRMNPPPDGEELMPYTMRFANSRIQNALNVTTYMNRLIKSKIDPHKDNMTYFDEDYQFKKTIKEKENYKQVYKMAKDGIISHVDGVPVQDFFGN